MGSSLSNICSEETNNGYYTSLSFKERKKNRDLSLINYNNWEGFNIQRTINVKNKSQEKTYTPRSLKDIKFFKEFDILESPVKKGKIVCSLYKIKSRSVDNKKAEMPNSKLNVIPYNSDRSRPITLGGVYNKSGSIRIVSNKQQTTEHYDEFKSDKQSLFYIKTQNVKEHNIQLSINAAYNSNNLSRNINIRMLDKIKDYSYPDNVYKTINLDEEKGIINSEKLYFNNFDMLENQLPYSKPYQQPFNILKIENQNINPEKEREVNNFTTRTVAFEITSNVNKEINGQGQSQAIIQHQSRASSINTKKQKVKNDVYLQHYNYEEVDINNKFNNKKISDFKHKRNISTKMKKPINQPIKNKKKESNDELKTKYSNIVKKVLTSNNDDDEKDLINHINEINKVTRNIVYKDNKELDFGNTSFKEKISKLIESPNRHKDIRLKTESKNDIRIKVLSIHKKKKCASKLNDNRYNSPIQNSVEIPSFTQMKKDLGKVTEKITKIESKQISKKNFKQPSSTLLDKILLKNTSLTKEVNELKKIDLLLSIPHSETRISKDFIINDKEINITFEKIINCNQPTNVIFDGQIEKVNIFKNGYKLVMRYFQITRSEFRYFNSIFSSSVWNDKPLFVIPIKNIRDIKISNESDKILSKVKRNLKIILDIEIVIDENIKDDQFQDVYHLRKNDLEDNKTNIINEKLVKITFTTEDEEKGLSLMKILILVKEIDQFFYKNNINY